MTGQFAARDKVRHPTTTCCGLAFDVVHGGLRVKG